MAAKSAPALDNFNLRFDTLLAVIYLLKVNNRKTRASCEICSELTIKTPERRQCLYC